jgi:ABC-type uncharacterized transport system fused permease/ATPase subunit
MNKEIKVNSKWLNRVKMPASESSFGVSEEIEENIVLNIKKKFTDTSILAISHRNSLIKYADSILELK